ncbi:MAG: RpiB/LacA/LacB family sugar-phosphate isomerase, partial [Pyrinomonadaceae bacterium]
PLAEDIVQQRNIKITRRQLRSSRSSHLSLGKSRLIAVGADHGGYKMKQELIRFLAQSGHQVRDCGTDSEKPVDYPDVAHAVAISVAEAGVDLGIIIDGAGVGSAIAANKVPGVRAAACYSVEVARNSREHNDANVLTLGSNSISVDQMREIVSVWISSEIKEERHKKRVAKITALERQYERQ